MEARSSRPRHTVIIQAVGSRDCRLKLQDDNVLLLSELPDTPRGRGGRLASRHIYHK
ncbi:uncharacterized protein LOC142767427 isoform X2 [Rhipicephalus microplus]|uniref:uncharacterized protein LOC142767427 isoform X2 n=1 Tax=Rhipicephalus microplus TaxID=6941 RepID=UPI003F6A9FE1